MGAVSRDTRVGCKVMSGSRSEGDIGATMAPIHGIAISPTRTFPKLTTEKLTQDNAASGNDAVAIRASPVLPHE
jgi:hypothetical protein